MSTFWQSRIVPSDAPCVVEAGEVRCFLKVDEGDWILGLLRDQEDRTPGLSAPPEVMPEGIGWQRLGSVEDLPEISLAPTYPDRALVVRPEMAYSVLPGERVQFYIGVAIWIRLLGPKKLTLMQFPIQTLSNTWFGASTDGELAYAMRTRARREGEHLDFGPLRVTCPVRVRNQSKHILKFERICIRPQFLSLYEDHNQGLWANESSVMVKSDESWSHVAYARKAPGHLKRPREWQKGQEVATGRQLLRALSSGKGFFNE